MVFFRRINQRMNAIRSRLRPYRVLGKLLVSSLAMPINILPRRRIDKRQLVRCQADDLPILVMEGFGIVHEPPGLQGQREGNPADGPEQGAWVSR